MKIAGIVCGGFSSEFEISLKSAQTIVSNFPKEYKAARIILTREKAEIEWEGQLLSFDLNKGQFHYQEELLQVDFVIIYIHGNPGENGKLQAFFDMQQIKYVNSGSLASELSFDKWYCNQFLKGFGIPVANSQLLLPKDKYNVDNLVKELGLPIFVKPCDSGSSYGISKANTREELQPAIDYAFKEGNSIVLESFLDGYEVTCGVYRKENENYALPLVMIKTTNEFFDYEAKYQGKSEEICPAPISDELKLKVQEVSKRIYSLLRLRSIARIDFMIVNNEPVLIEVNTTPGFSGESIVPKMIKADNNTIEQFWREILNQEL